MRTGADYRKSLRDGRRVWIMGEGLIEDVATHPATRAMVDEYVAWYDRHADPAWTDTVLTPDGTPISCLLPTSADDLVRMGKCFSATTFLSAGNITHTPAYGHLISLGILAAVQERNVSPKQIADATAYRELIARTERFLTFSGGGATIGYRMREDPQDRAALQYRARDRCRPGDQRQDRHAHQSGLRRGGVHRRPDRHRDRHASCDVHRAGRRTGRHHDVPQGLAARPQPVRVAAVQPVRRTRRPDVAGRGVHPVGAHLPARHVARADRPLAGLAPAVLLAVEGGVHPRPGAWPARTRWA